MEGKKFLVLNQPKKSQSGKSNYFTGGDSCHVQRKSRKMMRREIAVPGSLLMMLLIVSLKFGVNFRSSWCFQLFLVKIIIATHY